MSNQSNIKSIVAGLAITGGLIFPSLPNAYAGDMSGNVRIMAGQKQLKNDDWHSMDSQDAFGVLIDIKREAWPVSIAIDLFGSGADSADKGSVIERGYTFEQHIGIRKTWSKLDSKFHPYIDGGLALVQAGFENRDSAGGDERDDSSIGAWVGGGAYWNISSNINLGLDVRYSQAEVSPFDTDIEAGGLLAGVTLGYNW